ncbi:alpha/beta hydrolase [Luteitalea pratensis]|nr:acetylxylan esterase [Luteitalea pratensis]
MTPWPFSILLVALVACPAVAHHDAPFDYDSRTPLRLESTLVRREGTIEVHAISFDSPRGGRVTGKLFVPTAPRPTRLAGIVMAHGAPGSTANMDPRALFVARKGAVVIGIDAAFARRDRNDPITFTARDADEQVQTIVDMRRAVDVLVARDDVDPARLGFIGGSYGAAMGGILAGVEDRVGAFVLAVGDAGFVAHFTAADGSWLPPLSDLPGAERETWVAAMRPISGQVFLPRALGDRIYLQNGRADKAVLPHVAEAFHALAPAGAEKQWYEAGHRLPPSHFADQLAFLHRKIGTDAPVAADRVGPYPTASTAQ